MTVETDTVRVSYIGNGSATTFSYDFAVPDQAFMIVTVVTIATGATVILDDSEYTVTGIGGPTGGIVTYPLSGSPLDSAHQITIRREVPFDQPTNLTNQEGFYAEAVEGAFDYLEFQIQQIEDSNSRALTLRPQDIDGLGAYDAHGNRIINLGDPVDPTDAANLRTVQAQIVGAGNVPSPLLGQVGDYLKATGVGTFDWAPVTVSITPGSIGTTEIANLSITTAKLADGSVTTPKLADGAVTTVKIADGAVTSAKIVSITIGQIQATGSPSGATFLRGDGTWAGFAGGNVTSVATGPGLTGGPITTTGTISLDTNNAFGIGDIIIASYTGAGSLSHNATTSASNVLLWTLQSFSDSVPNQYWAYQPTGGGVTPTGTWRNISGADVNAILPGRMQRTA